MNIILLREADRDGVGYTLQDARADHITKILGCAPGATLRVGEVNGPLGEAEITQVEPGRVRLEVVWGTCVPPRPKIDLILAVPRPKALRRILPEVAAIGVDRLVLLRSWFVDPNYLKSKVLQQVEELLLEGLSQSGCTRVPRWCFEERFRPFLEDRLPGWSPSASRFVLDPRASTPLAQASVTDRAVVAIGPERGWLPAEKHSFLRAGFEAVHLGPRILRVETACLAVLAQTAVLQAQGLARD